MQKYHFISGLPRSGSTLLSAILKQNPKFCADISDPLHDYARNLLQVTHSAVGMEVSVPIEKRAGLIRGLFANFYEGKPEVCFNTNRAWTAQTSMVKDLFPYSKVIVCIRDVPWILDSFEQLNAKNPYSIKALYNHQDMSNVYMRCNSLMSMEGTGGYVTGPLTCLKQGLFSNEKDMLCVVDYEALCKRPRETMQTIYQFIGEPWFEHNFDNVEDSYDEFDDAANITGLHTVRKKVEFKQRKPILPSDIWENYVSSSFWKFDFDHIKRQLLWIE
jgi:sulfotransferase